MECKTTMRTCVRRRRRLFRGVDVCVPQCVQWILILRGRVQQWLSWASGMGRCGDTPRAETGAVHAMHAGTDGGWVRHGVMLRLEVCGEVGCFSAGEVNDGRGWWVGEGGELLVIDGGCRLGKGWAREL